MDFYISSLAARIPCTRLHRQVQDPRGRSVVAFAVSIDGRLAAMATYPREHAAVERSVNVLFKDGKAMRTSNYHKAVQRQRRLAEQHNELEYNVEQYINQTLNVDALGGVIREVALSTPSLRTIIKDNNAKPTPDLLPLVPCAIIIYDTMYFNPVEEFIYGYKFNDGASMNMNVMNSSTAIMSTGNTTMHLDMASTMSHKCQFRPNRVEFFCDDSLLALTSHEHGAKIFSMDTEYVELLCHYRPQLRNSVILEAFKVMKCEIVLDDLQGMCTELPAAFDNTCSSCQACKHAVMKDVETCKDDALPYTVVLDCVVYVTSHPPLLMTLHSKWPSGDVCVAAVRSIYSMPEPIPVAHDYLISKFKARVTNTPEFMALDRIHTYWYLEPYRHDHLEYLIQSDTPVKCNYSKTLLASEVKSKDYLEYRSLVAVWAPNSNLYVFNTAGSLLGQTSVPESEEGYFSIDVNRDGSMIAIIGTECIIVYRLFLSRGEGETFKVDFEEHTRFPQVIGVGRREEILSACFGRDLGNRWMYVSVARGSVDAVLYILDMAPSKGKDPVKRTLNMNSVIFPCVTDMVALDNSILVMPRHHRFLIQLIQEHLDISDDTHSRQFCHFPVLATNKEALTVNGPISDGFVCNSNKFDILIFERERQIALANRTSNRLNVGRWLDALYQYNALCMYKGRGVALGMDPHDYLLPPLRRTRQQFPFGYDAKQFYDPLVGVEFTGSPALMRAQCYEWVRDAISRSGYINPMYPMEVIYDEKLHMLDYVYAKICISQWDNPSEILFSMRTNDFLRLQLCNFLKISQRLDINCDAQGLIPYEKTMIYKKVSDMIPSFVCQVSPRTARQSRVSLERDAFQLIRQQLMPELMDIPSHKVKKIIRDRVYRLRKKLVQLERYKAEHDIPDYRADFTVDEVVRSDCRLPAFRDSIEFRELSLCEYAMRLRMKVLSSFYKAQKDVGPDYDEFDSS